MNKKIDLLDKLIRRKERKDAQVFIKTKKRRAQKKFANITKKAQRRMK